MTSIQTQSTLVESSTTLASTAKTVSPNSTIAEALTPAKKSVVVTLSSVGLALASKPTPITVSKSSETFTGNGEAAGTVQTAITINFSGAIKAGTGTIVIKDSKGATNTTIDITDSKQVKISGSILTISPTATQAFGSSYTVSIAAGAVVDASNASNAFAGTGKAPIAFTTLAATTISTQSATIFGTKPAISGTAAANSIVTIYDGSTSLGTTTASSKGAWTFTPTTALTAGDHVITANSSDGKSTPNVSGTSKAITLTVASVPTDQKWSWIGQLSDGKLITDFVSMAKANAVTEDSLSKAFSDFSSDIGKTMTASEVSDLTLINTKIGAAGASSYVQFITNALMNGTTSKGNDYYTGGTEKTVDLSKVSTSTTAATFTSLYNKWFGGTDYPANGKVAGSPVTIATYNATQNALYSGSAPSINDINQGQIGDCYFEASMSEVAGQNPSIIQNMITDNGNGTYGVKFNVGGSPVYITVDNKLPVTSGGGFNSSSGNSWSDILEKAYAQLQSFGDLTGNGKYKPGSSYATIGNGGYGVFALDELTGASEVDDVLLGSQQDLIYQASQFVPGGTSRTTAPSITASQVWADITKAMGANDDVLISSRTDASASGKSTLVADHQFAVTAISGSSATDGTLTLRNPWGTENGQTWDTTFTVKFSDLIADKDEVILDNINGSFKDPAPSSPQLNNTTTTPTKTIASTPTTTLLA